MITSEVRPVQYRELMKKVEQVVAAMERIERLWLVSGPGEPRAALLAAHEGMHVARVADSPFSAEHIYLVDPLGNLMMRFPRDPDPSRVIKDLQRLLKYSRVG